MTQRLGGLRPRHHQFLWASTLDQAIPLGEVHLDPPSSTRNVMLIDYAPTWEDAAPTTPGVVECTPARDYSLHNEEQTDFEGTAFWISNVRHDQEIYFGSAELEEPVYYQGDAHQQETPFHVEVVDVDTNTPLSSVYIQGRAIEEHQYIVTLYTKEPFTRVKVRYTAVPDQQIETEVETAPIFKEQEGAVSPESPYVFTVQQGNSPWTRVLHVPLEEQVDERTPITVNYWVQAYNASGDSFTSPRFVTHVYDGLSYLETEAAQFEGQSQVLFSNWREWLLEHVPQAITDDSRSRYHLIIDRTDIDLRYRTDGYGPVLARSMQPTGYLPPGTWRSEWQTYVTEVQGTLVGYDDTGTSIWEETIQGEAVNYDRWQILRHLDDVPTEVTLCRFVPDSEHVLYEVVFEDTQTGTILNDDEGLPQAEPSEHIALKVRSRHGANILSPVLFVRALDTQQISIQTPAQPYTMPWHVGIQEGFLFEEGTDSQGRPIKRWYGTHTDSTQRSRGRVYQERAIIVDEQRVAVMHRPLWVEQDQSNITVRVNGAEHTLQSWDSIRGSLTIQGTLRPTDHVEVDYEYQFRLRPYRGYYHYGQQYTLDLNPVAGRIFQEPAEHGGLHESHTSSLFYEPLSLYMSPISDIALTGLVRISVELSSDPGQHELLLPYAPLLGQVIQNLDDVLYWIDEENPRKVHYESPTLANPDDYFRLLQYRTQADRERPIPGTQGEYSIYHTRRDPFSSHDKLLGEVFLRPHVLPHMIRIDDRRERGGGLIQGTHNPEAALWDRQPLDGHAIPNAGIQWIQKPTQGPAADLDPRQIQEAAAVHLPFGVYPAVIPYKPKTDQPFRGFQSSDEEAVLPLRGSWSVIYAP